MAVEAAPREGGFAGREGRRVTFSGGRGSQVGDRVFRGTTLVFAVSLLVLLAAVFLVLFIDARLALGRYGLRFVTGQVWNPLDDIYGALPYIYGTIFTSTIALLIATPLAIGAALFIVEYAPQWLRAPVSFVVELLAAIPSVIFGLWGIFVLRPFMQTRVQRPLKNAVNGLEGAPTWLHRPASGPPGDPGFLDRLVEGPATGAGILTAAVILAIMILPTIMSVTREVINTVPDTQREGMLALGATKWEVIRKAVLPYARTGIAGAAILGLGRAVGETMAVTLVIGNSSTRISPSLLTPGYTMASAIATQFNEAVSPTHFSAVVGVAVILLIMTAFVNMIARIIVGRAAGDTRATGI